MTVVVNGRFLPQRPGGLQRTARSLLAALREAGADLEVLSPAADPLADRVLPAPPGRGGGQLWEQVRLPRAARGRAVLSLANTAPLASGRSTVLVHDLAPLAGPQWFRRDMQLYGRLVLAAARRAQRVLTVSEAAAGELRERGIADVAVVRPAVDPLFTPASPEEVASVRARLRLDVPYLLLPGWADPRKDVATALAASRAVASPHLLVLVGSGRSVFAKVPTPAGQHVRVLGHVTDADLRALLTGATALLYPSRYEGFGLPPLEAAACGTPSVVSDLPVLRESTGGAATFVPAGDVDAWARAMTAALEHPPAAPPRPTRTWADAAAEVAALL